MEVDRLEPGDGKGSGMLLNELLIKHLLHLVGDFSPR